MGGWSVDFAKLVDLGFAGSEIAQAWPLARYCWLLAELPVGDEGLHGKRFNRHLLYLPVKRWLQVHRSAMFGEFFYSRWAHQAKHCVFLVTAQRALPGQVFERGGAFLGTVR